MRLADGHCVFVRRLGDPRDLHSFPTRRSSDLGGSGCWRAKPPRRRGVRIGRRTTMPCCALLWRGLSTSFVCGGTKERDRKSTRLNSSHSQISYAVFCLKKKKKDMRQSTQLKRI